MLFINPELVQAYLDYLYKNKSGVIHYNAEAKELHLQKHIYATYGEILFPSLQKLLAEIGPTANDVFLDMGSGLGKVVVAVSLITSIQTLYGIEAQEPLVHYSNQMLKQVLAEVWAPQQLSSTPHIEFLTGNFLDAKFKAIIDTVTVIYICSTCFSHELMEKIGDLLNRAPNLRAVMSFKPIPTLNRLKFCKAMTVEASWDTAVCHIYC